MDFPDTSDGADKSWDHPWSTDEMRQHRNEWSLAADAGLLKHLEQFSNNLTETISRTQEKFNSLTNDLNETSIIVDNITNASLALANTQFIESRVHEDDIETKPPQITEGQKTNDEEVNKEDLIACVSESIKQGLSIMDEKFQRLEVLASDSEDEGEVPTPSIVLKPKDPYQNRPLPYVIGSEKWKASSRVGLESSSSDSEPPEGESESASDDDQEMPQRTANVINHRESMLRRSSSSSSVSTDRNGLASTVKNYSGVSSRTDKLEARSQDTLNSGSEIATPMAEKTRTENSSKGAPSFAEELAKRLGKVVPSSATPVTDSHEADQSSINRFKDDLFAPDHTDVFGSQSDNLFSDNNNLFDAEVSSSLWKDKPLRVSKSTIIPPSFDVPPPMHEVEKPKSAFDDLCGDADSEDSDDIFASKTSSKPSSKTPANKLTYPSDDHRESGDSRENKFLKIAQGENVTNMATSTPETNDNGGLFGDETDDDDDELFGSSVKSRNRITARSPEVARAATRSKPPGLSITQADILSSNLGSRLFQRVPRQNSSDSSDTEAARNNEDTPVSEPNIPESSKNFGASTQNISEPSSILAGNGNGSRVVVEDSSASSGISIQPNSTNNTFGVGLGVDFQPQLESTRLKSEDLYRERVTSDSLLGGRFRQQENASALNNNSSNRPHDGRIAETVSSNQEEDFDSDDVFGPPPLPKADSKTKSDTSSVDDLFSNASSGSRSRKSSDLLTATEPQYGEKSTAGRSRGLFDEDIDIFGTADVPDVDIFGEGFASSLPTRDTKPSSPKIDEKTSETSTKKSTSLFSATLDYTADLAGQQKSATKSDRKTNSIFDDSEDDDDDDLFGSSFLKSDRKIVTMLQSDDDNLFASKPKSFVETVPSETKKDFTSEESECRVADSANNSSTRLDDKPYSDEATDGSPAPSYPSGGLFDHFDDDDDDDDSLFDSKKIDKSRDTNASVKVGEKPTVKSVESHESKTVESKFKTNCEIEELLKDQSAGEADVTKSGEKEDRPRAKPPVSAKSPGLLTKRHDNDLSRKTTSAAEMEDEVSTTDGAKISKARSSTETIGEITKRDPPKTLSIRLPVPSVGEDSAQAPRRAVSSKIKNLMGKMGDLEKILSPTDAPPLWRKTEEKSDDEPTNSRDSEDGSSISVPSAKSPNVVSSKAEDPNVFPEVSREQVPSSPQNDSGNSESAVSFDVPAQVETLAVTASKSRARIQAKRRPQSRHARHSALRKSGIDFDTVDKSGPEAVESDPSDNTFSGISDKIPTVVTDSIDSPKENIGSERLTAPDTDADSRSADKPAESSFSLAPDDRSELSFSKGSSMSINKNTLLSPSTDEEDLFDVPPDLPEDPPKEDTLFGRAPILSPIDGLLGAKHTRTKQRSHDNRGEFGAAENTLSVHKDSKSTQNEETWRETAKEKKDSREADIGEDGDEPNSNDDEKIKPTDPLRDSSHDPLKDPSQLFAFVTKTPSPEKGQNLLFKEDDSLFTRLAKKSAEEAKAASKKSALDLFADDSSGDLFSGSLAKASKKSIAASKSNSLFDDTDTDEDGTSDLFGSAGRAKGTREKIETVDDVVAGKSRDTSGRPSPSRGSIFGEDADDDLFVDALDKKFPPEPEKSSKDAGEDRLFPATSKIAKDAKLQDIFGDQSSGEEDIFATKKIIGKSRPTGSLFDGDGDDEDVDDIFGKKLSTKGTTVETIDSRNTPKKPMTRDLKKTAEKIVGDPLSMLQDD